MITKYCKGCEHLVKPANGYECCNYLLDTGWRRPCPSGDGCTVHTKLSGVSVWHRFACGARWDIRLARTMFAEGKSDKEIADAVGISCGYFKHWRAQNGLYRPGKPSWDAIRAEQMVRNGASDAEISEKFGKSSRAVADWRRSIGIKHATRGKWDYELARKIFAEGGSDQEIGDAVGRSPQTIQRWRLKEKLYRDKGGSRDKR